MARKLPAIRPGLPVVLYTGYMEEGLQQRAYEAGIATVVMKPYDIARMAMLIRDALKLAEGRCDIEIK